MGRMLDIKKIENFDDELKKINNFKAMQNALFKNSINNVSYNSSNLKFKNQDFAINLFTLPAENQRMSGRCWIFAAVNLMRESICKKLNLENFALSQSYIAFWDKFERTNFFLESLISLNDAPTDDRLYQFILETGIQDGGQWDMIVNVVEKYGVVPQNVMPDNFQASNTSWINYLLNWKLRDFAAEMKSICNLGENALRDRKDGMLKEIYRLLLSFYGPIPERFDFEYTQKIKNTSNYANSSKDFEFKYNCEKDLTPLEFYNKYIDIKLDAFVSIIHAPQKSKPFNRKYSFEYLNNVVGGKPICHYNLDLNFFKYLIVNQLLKNMPVWFGADCSWYFDRENGVWDKNSFDYSTLFSLNFDVDKGDMLTYKISAMNHAMLITGVNLDSDKLCDMKNNLSNNLSDFYKQVKNLEISKWKIENSWGDLLGDNGYFIMSDNWFNSFVYQAVVLKSDLEKIIQRYGIQNPDSQETIILEPWDPIGTLA
ncbi:MAG: C1 family peptidase [Malacoplasma sp.]|nr:C1 family peptidase [Malacoplasma sp.]